MAVALYMDVHVKQAITDQLRRRGVDVLTAIEDGHDQVDDDVLLERAKQLNRIVFTQDILFEAMAHDWQRQGKPFAGLTYGHQQGRVGPFVLDLELIAKATDLPEWVSRVDHLPY